MREKDILKTLLDRLARSGGMSNVFTADEVSAWPEGALESLMREGLLKRTDSADSAKCSGCEEYCTMPVNVVQNEARGSTRAFIACDKRDDVGRVPLELESLSQWRITGHLTALKLTEMLGFGQDPKEKQRGKVWELGAIKGESSRSRILLNLENGVKLKIGSCEAELLDLLTFKKGNLFLDMEEITRIANIPQDDSPRYTPSVIQREARKMNTQTMYNTWQNKYRELRKGRPNMSMTWYSKQIAKSAVAQGRDFETIRRHIKK